MKFLREKVMIDVNGTIPSLTASKSLNNHNSKNIDFVFESISYPIYKNTFVFKTFSFRIQCELFRGQT